VSAKLAHNADIFLDPNNSSPPNDGSYQLALNLQNISTNESIVYLDTLTVYQNGSNYSITTLVNYDFNDHPLEAGIMGLTAYLYIWNKPVPSLGIYNVTIILTWKQGNQTAPIITDTYYSTMQVIAPTDHSIPINVYGPTLLILFALFVGSPFLVAILDRRKRKREGSG
jgi:hypothetical protein